MPSDRSPVPLGAAVQTPDNGPRAKADAMTSSDRIVDPELSAALASIDRAFAASPRPDKFTDHAYCEECAEADEYFRNFTPVTIADITDPPETLPLSFLTDQAFRYLLPGILRWLPRTGRQYCVGDVLFHVENRLHAFNAEQRAAIRDLLYIAYDRLKSEIESTAFDYPTIRRILNELDRSPDDSLLSSRGERGRRRGRGAQGTWHWPYSNNVIQTGVWQKGMDGKPDGSSALAIQHHPPSDRRNSVIPRGAG